MPISVFGHHGEEADEFVLFVVRWIFELGVCEEGREDAKVGVSERDSGGGQVEKVAEDDVEEDVEVVGIEVLVGGRGGEEEVEEFEDEELEGGFAFAV